MAIITFLFHSPPNQPKEVSLQKQRIIWTSHYPNFSQSQLVRVIWSLLYVESSHFVDLHSSSFLYDSTNVSSPVDKGWQQTGCDNNQLWLVNSPGYLPRLKSLTLWQVTNFLNTSLNFGFISIPFSLQGILRHVIFIKSSSNIPHNIPLNLKNVLRDLRKKLTRYVMFSEPKIEIFQRTYLQHKKRQIIVNLK